MSIITIKIIVSIILGLNVLGWLISLCTSIHYNLTKKSPCCDDVVTASFLRAALVGLNIGAIVLILYKVIENV